MSGRGKSRDTLELVEAMHDILQAQNPATVRGVCYALFVRGCIDSMEKRNTQKVSRQLVWAREQGIIPWSWVVDEHRDVEQVPSWDNPEALIDAAVSQYRKDYWRDQPCWIEVWSEKGTIRGVLGPILTEYGLPFRVMHGYSSATVIQQVASESLSRKPLVILYVGDWDPSGMNMSEVDIPQRIARYGGMADIQRVALTEHDIAGLPSFDVKSGDTRARWFVENYGRKCWELDAMPASYLRKAVEGAIRDHLDMDAWEHAKSIEQAETDSLREVVGRWKESISRQDSKYSGGAS